MVITPADAPAPGLRERQKAARRSALIDAAHDLVEADGLDAVTVEDICRRAGVSPRTFFNYFDTKDDAVLGHVPWVLDAGVVEAFVAGGPHGHLGEDVAHLLSEVLGTDLPDRARMERGIAIARSEPRLMGKHMAWLDEHKDALQEVVLRRLGADDPRGDLATVLVLLLIHTALTRRDAGTGDGSAAAHLLPALADLRSLLSD